MFNNVINLAAIAALEEAGILANRPIRRRSQQICNPLEDLSDKEFVQQYRLTKELTLQVIDLVEPYIEEPVKSDGLSVSRKVLVALRFFASGSYQMDIGRNINHCVSQASVSKCIQEVTDALNQPNIISQYIHLPRNLEGLRQCRTEFYREFQFPGVIGCVDCTHVAIYPPHVPEEAVYVNRKGYHSINVQLICDSNLEIMNVCAQYPGSTHDSYIWNNSRASEYIINLHQNGHASFYFLGDSLYALRPWLLTPLANAQPGTNEERYNQRHRSTRSLIEQCNGVLKLRFRCLLKHRVLHYSPIRCSKIINSCCILHNMCIRHGIPNVQLNDEDQGIHIEYGLYVPEQVGGEAQPGNRINRDLLAGRRLQQNLIRNHFNA